MKWNQECKTKDDGSSRSSRPLWQTAASLPSPWPSAWVLTICSFQGPTPCAALSTHLPGPHFWCPFKQPCQTGTGTGLEDTAPFGCRSGMEGLSRRATASKAHAAWISNKNILQSCLSCTRVCDDSTLHSSTTARFLWAQAGCSHLKSNSAGTHPPGPCHAGGANTPLQITLLTSDYILWDTRALLHHMLLEWLQRRAPLPSFCTSTLGNSFSLLHRS